MNPAVAKTAFGKRRGFLLFLGVLFFFCLWNSNLKPKDFAPTEAGLKVAKEFFTTALTPALDYQSEGVPESAPPYYHKIVKATWLTLKYATCGISIALPIGILMGFFASRSWWQLESSAWPIKVFIKISHRICKTIITVGRSIHELLWGILFISAIGTTPLSIIFALAIPYGCTLAKVFSELLDEQELNCRDQLRNQGAGAFTSWLFGILPLAFSDLISYALYRYECAIRSAAIFGFVGVQTIGYHIETASADGNINEVWTLLYSLLALILTVEYFSKFARKKLTAPQQSKTKSSKLGILIQHRPKYAYLKYFSITLIAVIFFAWFHDSVFPNVNLLHDDSLNSRLTSEQRWKNFNFFIDKKITPKPVRESGNWADTLPWAKELLFEKGFKAALSTFYIATAAMILAWFTAIFILPWSSRILQSAKPFSIHLGTSKYSITFKTFLSSHPLFRRVFKANPKYRIKDVTIFRYCISALVRFIFVITRALPEYLLAFLLLRIFGPTAWPLILALAIHNFGIVGRLGGEIVDLKNFNHTRQQLSVGGSRINVFLFSILPSHFNRFLLYFFYRWETCIRDATILGMLGISSLGYLINDATARNRYDELLFYTLLGACIVIIGDLLSDFVRSRLRSAS